MSEELRPTISVKQPDTLYREEPQRLKELKDGTVLETRGPDGFWYDRATGSLRDIPPLKHEIKREY